MLRACLIAMSAVLMAMPSYAAPATQSGPHHGRGTAPRALASPPSKLGVRPPTAVRHVGGYQFGAAGYPVWSRYRSSVIISGLGSPPIPRYRPDRLPVVVGIRRAPEAAPVLYQIGSDRRDMRTGAADRHSWLSRNQRRNTITQENSTDTSTLRVVVVHRN